MTRVNAMDRYGLAAYQERMAGGNGRLSPREAEALRIFLTTARCSSLSLADVARTWYTPAFVADVRAACELILDAINE